MLSGEYLCLQLYHNTCDFDYFLDPWLKKSKKTNGTKRKKKEKPPKPAKKQKTQNTKQEKPSKWGFIAREVIKLSMFKINASLFTSVETNDVFGRYYIVLLSYTYIMFWNCNPLCFTAVFWG